jgi:ATP-dependent exoDNAse (exonuclease V) alpha subunit
MCVNNAKIAGRRKLDETLDLVLSGASCIIKGRAGTGKSTLVKEFAELASSPIILTAPTGVAALNIGGQTISSFLRLGIYKYSDERITEENEHNYISPTSILVIDESYGLNAAQMHQIDVALRSATGVNKIFGGLQVILSGDDCQLLSHEEGKHWQYEPFFKDLPSIELDYSFRHENDSLFLSRLNELRDSIKSRRPLNLGTWWGNVLPYLSNVNGTDKLIIAPHFKEAQKINSAKQKLLGLRYNREIMTLKAEPYGPEIQDIPYIAQEVCVGTPVIYTLNRHGLVNGSMGVITDIAPEEEKVYVLFNGNMLCHRVIMEDVRTADDDSGAHYIPLLRAFSLSARKVQGLTLEGGVISETFLSVKETEEDIRRLYVAMSRFTTLDDIEMYHH